MVVAGLLLTACSPDKYDLGAREVTSDELVEGIAYTITHDASNPNIVYLESKMGSKYTALWEHPQGRSQEQKVTLRIPFEGTYEVTFGVMTGGGVVYGEPAEFTIEEFYADFVNDEMWTFLTGGVGNSKIWIHDNGEYGLASGEVDYADPSTVVEYNNFTPNWSPGKGHTEDDNIWGSTMTFSLDGGAFIAVHNASASGDVDETGTFMLDTDAKTLTITNAKIMHTQSWDYKTTNWNRGLKILTLTENQLQVAVFREEVSGEGEWWMIWNYVSKEYADNYEPEDRPDPVPDIGGDPNNILTTSNTKTWVLSTDSPYDWADLDGTLMNNFASSGEYLATGWAAYDADMVASTRFVFTSTSSSGGKFVFSSYDNEDVEGEYTIDSKNDIDFKQPLEAVISETNFGWVSTMKLNTNADNKLRMLKTKTDALGSTITDMWLGLRSTEKNEYMVYHFVLGDGSLPSVDAAKELKKQLTNNGTRTYKLNDGEGIAFTWGRGDPKKLDFTEAYDSWMGIDASNNANYTGITLTLNMSGEAVLDVKGDVQTGTFTISDSDATGMDNIIVFDGLTSPAYDLYGGWLPLDFASNSAGDNTHYPTDKPYWELYKIETDANGAVAAVWFARQTAPADDMASERICYHFVVE